MNAPSLDPVLVNIAELHPDPSNARKHSERNVQAIASSLSMFGQRRPIVVQKQGMIVRAGNGLLQAAKSLGWTQVVALVCDDDNATAVQFAIADNRTAELAEWDNETLALLLDGFSLEEQEAVGFDADEVKEILGAIADNFAPGTLEDQQSLDQKTPITCPNCKHEFIR